MNANKRMHSFGNRTNSDIIRQLEFLAKFQWILQYRERTWCIGCFLFTGKIGTKNIPTQNYFWRSYFLGPSSLCWTFAGPSQSRSNWSKFYREPVLWVGFLVSRGGVSKCHFFFVKANAREGDTGYLCWISHSKCRQWSNIASSSPGCTRSNKKQVGGRCAYYFFIQIDR